MDTVADSLLDTIQLEFEFACQELALAKLSRRGKDTPAARARVAACREWLDALLDMRNAAGLAV
jgi:hypothetical protein